MSSIMPSIRKNSPVTEDKMKTWVSDTGTYVSKKKSVIVENDGSCLQAQASHSVFVSNPPPSEQVNISASTGQDI